MKKKLRVLLLCHEELVPPESIDGRSDEEIQDYRTEYDVMTALRDLGHTVEVGGVGDDIEDVRRAVQSFEPDICFNLLVEFHGFAHFDQHVPSYLELLRVPYTGCNPRGLTLARDKALSKKILRFDGVPVPDFAVFERGRAVRRPKGLEYPLFVKSIDEEASLGISRRSIVHTDAELAERARFIHEKVKTDAIAETFIEGRELYVGILGGARPRVFPPWELCMANLPEGQPLIATRKVKWDIGTQKRLGVKNRRAELEPGLERRIASAARRAWSSLSLSGFARLDVRLRPDGSFFFLEANPNPDLTFGEDFAESAEAGGIGYEALVERILREGLRG
ncbi:MAG TPA: D-alanine--D-alanine ligase [Planctomycetes bacterium]|nr:D-alanine--D-alanine ligase [Planctomycetota bacterium]